jgi:putative oxidoreductase
MYRWTPYVFTAVRIIVGFNLARHGTIKLFGFPSGDPVPLMTLSGASGVLELAGGLLVLLGLFAQPVALVLAAEMALIYLTTNLPRGFWTVQNGGDPQVFHCFFFLFLWSAGAKAQYLDSPRTQSLLSVLRIAVGFMFLQWGVQKTFGVLGGTVFHDFRTMLAWAGVVETLGAPFILLGLFTRPAAFLLSGEMAVAYFYRWAPQGFWPSLERTGELTVYYSFIFLFFWAAGGGTWSLDKLISRKSAPAESKVTV